MTPYRIAVVDDLERDRAWLAEKLADYMARDRLEYELTAFASGEGFSAALEQGQRFNLVFMDIYMDGITGIEAAQALRGKTVTLYREDMDENVIFAGDLIGMEVFSQAKRIGELTQVLDYPGNQVYVVKGEREYMLPAVKEFILSTDLDGNRMEVKLLEGMETDAD